MKERRRFIRFHLPITLEMSVDGDHEPVRTGQSLDFSRQGIRFMIAGQTLFQGCPLKFKTYIPKRRAPVLFEARMRWTRAKDDLSEIGAKIEKMSPEDKNAMLEYAYNLWREVNYGS